MFSNKKAENPHPHIKYTKFGEPYLDVEKFYNSDLAKKLEERSKEIDIILENESTHKKRKLINK